MARLTEADIAALERLCPSGVVRDVDLARISQWQIGGRADVLLRPSKTSEVSAICKWLHDRAIEPVLIGLTSNLLFADEGLRVPVVQLASRMNAVEIRGREVRAEAGVWVPRLARKLMRAELAGAEHISGIPGTLGGLICMNGGSQRKAIGNNILTVESVNKIGEIKVRSGVDCGFRYRQSIYQRNKEIITGATLCFERAGRSEIRREMVEILASRRRKFPRKLPNCGSVFISDPALYKEHGPPGAIIERLGFKGRKLGGAMVSPVHANFIVNTGGAKSADVLGLIREISEASSRDLGAPLTAEVRYIAPDGENLPASAVPIERRR